MSTYQLHQTARGLYKVAVVDAATKEVVWEQKEWGKNLILNNGMDAVAVRYWATCMSYAVAGTGIIPTAISSAEVTASQAGSTVSATVGSYTFSSGDIGNMIKWDVGGEEARITGYTNPQSVTVTPAQSVGSGTFVVYQTNQTGMATEVKRTTTYLPNAPYCQTSVDTSTGVVAMRRTYDFSAEVIQRNYTEVGACWNQTAFTGNTTFSRILLPLAVTVNPGQQLRFVYELQIMVGPITPVSFSAAVSGWPVLPSVNTNATQQLEHHGLQMVSATGSPTNGTGGFTNEPSEISIYGGYMFVSPNSTAFQAFDTSTDRRTTGYDVNAMSLLPYTPLSFTLDKTATFTVAQLNRTDLRTVGITANYSGLNLNAAVANGLVVLFAQSQSKNNTQTLTFIFRFTWGRTLA